MVSFPRLGIKATNRSRNKEEASNVTFCVTNNFLDLLLRRVRPRLSQSVQRRTSCKTRMHLLLVEQVWSFPNASPRGELVAWKAAERVEHGAESTAVPFWYFGLFSGTL